MGWAPANCLRPLCGACCVADQEAIECDRAGHEAATHHPFGGCRPHHPAAARCDAKEIALNRRSACFQWKTCQCKTQHETCAERQANARHRRATHCIPLRLVSRTICVTADQTGQGISIGVNQYRDGDRGRHRKGGEEQRPAIKDQPSRCDHGRRVGDAATGRGVIPSPGAAPAFRSPH